MLGRARGPRYTLPAVSAAAGALLAVLALALALWSKELVKDAMRAECAAHAAVIARELRGELELLLREVARGARPAEAAGVWWIGADGAVVEASAAGPSPSRLLESVAAYSGGQPLALSDVDPAGAPRAATFAPTAWLEAEGLLRARAARSRGVLVEWDLARLRASRAEPHLLDPAGRYAAALVEDEAAADALPFRARAQVALEPPLSGLRLAVGLQDAGGLRRNLRIQTTLLGSLVAWLLAVLGGSLYLFMRRERQRADDLVAREHFLTRAYHELQTPLALMRAAAETVGRGAADRPQDLARCVDILLREEERLTRTIRRLLRYLRLQSSDRQVGVRALLGAAEPLGEAVEQAAQEARDALEAAGLELAVSIDPAVREEAAPGELVRDTVVELLANARKHAAGARRIEVTLAPRGGATVLAVADDGPGVSDPARAFEAWRGDGPGSGLGLALLREGWATIDGRVTVAPSERGARLEVTIPKAR